MRDGFWRRGKCDERFVGGHFEKKCVLFDNEIFRRKAKAILTKDVGGSLSNLASSPFLR